MVYVLMVEGMSVVVNVMLSLTSVMSPSLSCATDRCDLSVRHIGATYRCDISVRHIGATYRCAQW